MRATEGIDAQRVTQWLRQHTALTPPLTFHPITGGHSNLTFLVKDAANRQWVLRRPPLNSVLATAHDMGREHRIISALADSDVPVPATIAMCDDASVTGAPFYVMAHVDGVVVRDATIAQDLSMPHRRLASADLISVLARLHRIRPDDVGLGDLGRRESYVARQLRRWDRQVRSLSTRELPLLFSVHERLTKTIPPQHSAGIVHGDYKIENCIVGDDGRIAAVLDWELCTLGDVRADVGMLMVYWVEPEDTLHPLVHPPTSIGGFARRRDLLERYCAETGSDFPEIDYFVAFAYWRLACIIEGVYTRYKAAAMGGHIPDNVERFARAVEQLTERAADILGGTSAV